MIQDFNYLNTVLNCVWKGPCSWCGKECWQSDFELLCDDCQTLKNGKNRDTLGLLIELFQEKIDGS